MSRRMTVAVAAGFLMLAAGTVSAAALDGLTLQPSEALPGTSVAVVPDFKFAPGCAVFWDGTEVASADGCGNQIPMVITATGAPGTHTAVLCTAGCDGADAITESAPFVVDEVVPSLSGSPLGDAIGVLAGTGLVGAAGGSPNEQDTVVGSVPSAGAEIAPGGTVQLLVSAPPPNSSASTVATSTADHKTGQSSATAVVTSSGGPTQQHSSTGSGVLPVPPNRNTAWPLVGATSLAALLALAALAWWLHRRARARAGRHVRSHPAAAPTRVYVTTRDARASARLDRSPHRAWTVDVRTTRRTTVELTKEIGHAT